MKDLRISNYQQKIVGVKRQSEIYRKGFGIGKLNLTTTAKMVQMKLDGQRRTQNVEGDFYVDHKCINCDVCRWMAPQVFALVDRKSAVYKQPSCEKERLNALQALLSCPTSSIHTEKPAHDILEVQETFPLPIDEHRIPGVYHCGYHSEASYGATSYFITHPDGNILVDSPRYTEKLAHKIELLGGARYMFLTHKDDVADHKKWSKRLGCHRVLHSQDVEDHTADVETKLEGGGPWNLGNEFELIHTPGHSKGCVSLFYKPLKVIFTGDHFGKEQSELSIWVQYNHYSGHGRRVEFEDTQQKNEAIKAFLTVKGEALGHFI
ncbi:uncharacterized protein LOC113302454 [Papaver somniferum]|uniref:uncharacterized protein LOC113302454 n=1 Tax=Papaver somniferum TaxID=3469 RepID=UPI000E6FFFDD|nr:uncharacterized protein LOC113302454 [Papaver somniferum]